MNNKLDFLISPNLSELNKFRPNLRIGILASGEGTNFQVLIDSRRKNELDIDIKVLISNNINAGCINRATKASIKNEVLIESEFNNKIDFENKIIKILQDNEVELVVLAGWMKILSDNFIKSFKNRIINIHPSLLPSFKGKDAVFDALKNGSKITGCSVHFVIEEVDSGKLIIQGALPIHKEDNKETLTNKIQIIEHKILPYGISEAGLIVRGYF